MLEKIFLIKSTHQDFRNIRESYPNKRIKMCKVQWSHHTEEEATWEREEEWKAEFPNFFSDPSESRG
jgi:hypothetical protein